MNVVSNGCRGPRTGKNMKFIGEVVNTDDMVSYCKFRKGLGTTIPE